MSKSIVAISYARFSSKGQAKGRSLKRQQEMAEEYAAKHGLVLDKSLSAQDLARSAYDKSNIVKGELGRLLAAIDDGKVPIGATLIVESFDRLSRATPLDALEVLTGIVNAGLNLVTLTDPPLEFSRSILEEQPMLLHVAILVMQRAHEESKRKSGRVKDAWAELRTAAAQYGSVMTLKTPLWVCVTGTASKSSKRSFQLIPDRAAVVKQIVEEAIKGVGNSSLTRWLNAQKVGAWTEQGWTHSVMQRMLSNHALYGAIELDGRLVEDYYPAVIDKTTFLFLQERRSQRATKKSTNRGGQYVTNLFSGRLRCGYCGAGMGVCGSVKLKDTGQVRKYIACFGARKDRDRCSMVYWPLDELETKALIWMLNLNYQELFGNAKNDVVVEQKRLAELSGKLDDIAKATNQLLKLYVASGDDPSDALVSLLASHQAEQRELTKQVDAQRAKVAAVQMQKDGSQGRMRGLLLAFKAMREAKAAYEASGDNLPLRSVREKLSAGIADVLDELKLFPSGPTLKSHKNQRYMEAKLKTGKVYTIDDFDEGEDPYAIDANLMKLLEKQEFMASAKPDEPR